MEQFAEGEFAKEELEGNKKLVLNTCKYKVKFVLVRLCLKAAKNQGSLILLKPDYSGAA